jgi:MoxR-like ATPase
MRISIGYPPLAAEAQMLTEQTTETPLESLTPVATATEVLDAIADARRIYVEESVQRYVVGLLHATRGDSRLFLGASPRAGINLLRVAKARALVAQRDYLIPDDVKAVAPAVLSHRLILGPEARTSGLSAEDVVREAVEQTSVPA